MRGLDQRAVDLVPRPTAPRGTDTWNLAGRTAVTRAAIGANAINLVFLGQSLNNNSIDGTYTPTYGSAVFNGSLLHGGQLFQAAKPLLASDIVLDHHGRWLADKLIAAGRCAQVVIWMGALGGSYCADWAPQGGTAGTAGAQTGVLAWRIGMIARCIHRAELGHLRTVIDWEQGQADTDSATSQAQYEAAMAGVIGECRSSGLLRSGNGALFVAKSTRLTGLQASRDAVRAAQAAVVDGSLVRAGADTDTLGTGLRTDGTHFSVAGADAQADLKATAYAGFLA